MDLISGADVVYALRQLLDPMVVLWLAIGVIAGLIFGAAPGVTATAGIAILTPFTFTLGFEASMALLLGAYCSGYFAGSYTAILINTPGTPSNAATAIDGYPMALNGEANRAMSLATACSFVGGFFSAAVLGLIAPGLAKVALSFTSVEYFGLAMLGLVCVAGVSGPSLLKGIAAGFIGVLLATFGIDPVSGTLRFDFGMPQLQGGLPILPALIGLFAISELLSKAARAGEVTMTLPPQKPFRLLSLFGILLRNRWLTLKSAVIGTIVGVLPGTGPIIASWIAYGEAARSPKPGDRYGRGEEKGVIACEVSNNAVTGGAMVPLLTVGIPGDPVTAILIGALLYQGIDPGPFFIRDNGDKFMHILVMLVAANVLMLVFGLAARRFLPYVVRIPTYTLVPVVAVLSAAGGYSINATGFEVGLIVVCGLAGYMMIQFGLPVGPILLGLVLGPYVEENLRNGLAANDGDWSVFFTRPISAGILATMLLLLYFFWRSHRRGRLVARES
ncbi:MAG: tripartite tricarboxylate transporter permease [Rhodospirillales bacterium]